MEIETVVSLVYYSTRSNLFHNMQYKKDITERKNEDSMTFKNTLKI